MTNLNEECLLQFLQKAKRRERERGLTKPDRDSASARDTHLDSGQDYMSFPSRFTRHQGELEI